MSFLQTFISPLSMTQVTHWHRSTFHNKIARHSLSYRPSPNRISRSHVITAATGDLPKPSRSNNESNRNSDVSYEQYVDHFNNSESMDPSENPDAVNLLKWSDISFSSIQEEMDAIEEYVKAENMPEDDPWPMFLRGAAYEHWGQPKLALAQYSLTKHAGGLRQVPEIWERRAYNAFKTGEVVGANMYFDVAAKIAGDADGNHLHFLHWFYENFSNSLPKRNGPSASTQHGICKYCIGNLHSTRDLLAAQIAINAPDVEHALLFFMAASYRLAPDKGLSKADKLLCERTFKSDRTWDQRLGLLVLLFSTAAQKDVEPQQKYYQQICDIIEDESPHVDITTHSYMALYHDAFTRDVEKRDNHLDAVSNLSGTLSPNDIENFLYHVANNRLSNPPESKMGGDVPEVVP